MACILEINKYEAMEPGLPFCRNIEVERNRMRVNCWEAKGCGRQPGGEKVNEHGICPAAVEVKANGINGGINGGRSCWAIQKTLCGDQVQGTFTQKLNGCMQCEFYSSVRDEERSNYQGSKQILLRISGNI